jgi:hypothetical protein
MADEQLESTNSMSINVLATASRFRESLSVSEATRLALHHSALSNPRELVVYDAIFEVEKAMFVVLGLVDQAKNEGELDDNDPFLVAARAARGDQGNLVSRKLMEVLVDLILFGNTNSAAYYRDYLLHQELIDVLRAQRERERSYGAPSFNYQHQIERTRNAVAELEKNGLDLNKTWYRSKADGKPSKPIAAVNKISMAGLSSSFATRLRGALRATTDHERIALGFNYYTGFAQASRGVHAGGDLQRQAPQRVPSAQPIMLAMGILLRAHELCGVDPLPDIVGLKKLVESADAEVFAKRESEPRAQVRDLVIAAGELAEVIDETEGLDTKYKSYKVRYLSKPLLPDVPEDWHISREIAVVATAAQFWADVEKHAPALLSSDQPTISRTELFEHYKEACVELWNAGPLKQTLLASVVTTGPDRQSKARMPDVT